jgi:hypothetical protein
MAKGLEAGVEPELVMHPERFRTTPMAVTTAEADFQRLWEAHEQEFKHAIKPN